MNHPLTIRPSIPIGVYPGDHHLCSRETCGYTQGRNVCELFHATLTPTDYFDELGNRLLTRDSRCQKADHEVGNTVYRWDETPEHEETDPSKCPKPGDLQKKWRVEHRGEEPMADGKILGTRFHVLSDDEGVKASFAYSDPDKREFNDTRISKDEALAAANDYAAMLNGKHNAGVFVISQDFNGRTPDEIAKAFAEDIDKLCKMLTDEHRKGTAARKYGEGFARLAYGPIPGSILRGAAGPIHNKLRISKPRKKSHKK